MESDNSFNELLTVTTNDERLGFSPLGIWFESGQYTDDYFFTIQ
jgi:hypothetical protein